MNIQEVISFAERNSKIKPNTMSAYIYGLRRLCRYANSIKDTRGEEEIIDILIKYTGNYLRSIISPSQRASSSSIANFWLKMARQMRFAESTHKSDSIQKDASSFPIKKAKLPQKIEKLPANEKPARKNDRSINEDSNSNAQNKNGLHTVETKESKAIAKRPRTQIDVGDDKLSPYLKELWKLILRSKDSKEVFSDRNTWSEATIGIMAHEYRCLIGFIALDNSKNAELGGLGIEIDKISIFDLTNPRNLEKYIEFRIGRVGELTSSILLVFRLILAFVRPKNEWIRKNIDWIYEMHAEKLEPQSTLSKREQRYLEEIEDDYKNSNILESFRQKNSKYEKPQKEIEFYAQIFSLYDHIYDSISKMYTSIKNKIGDKISQDPFIPIENLVKTKKPLKMVALALVNERKSLLKLLSGETDLKHMKRIQRHLIASIITILPLRSSHWKKMTYIDGKSGHLIQISGKGYIIVNPTSDFKNGKSIEKNRKTNVIYIPILNEKLDTLKEILKIYIENYLPLLSHLNKKNLLFPNFKGESICPGRELKEWVTKVLISTCESHGIKGVLPFRCHAFRHLGAMHVLKRTKSFEAAADFLLDDIKTVKKYYLKYVPDDYLKGIIDDNIDDIF